MTLSPGARDAQVPAKDAASSPEAAPVLGHQSDEASYREQPAGVEAPKPRVSDKQPGSSKPEGLGEHASARPALAVRECPYALKHGDNICAQVVSWVRDATGGAVNTQACPTEEQAHELFRSGVLLCELANSLQPGAVKRIERKEAPFQMRENIANFIAAAKALGVPNNELFDVADLFEAKKMRQVLICLYALGRASHGLASYSGPRLGKPVTHAVGAHKSSAFRVISNQGLWGKSGGAHPAEAGKGARVPQ